MSGGTLQNLDIHGRPNNKQSRIPASLSLGHQSDRDPPISRPHATIHHPTASQGTPIELHDRTFNNQALSPRRLGPTWATRSPSPVFVAQPSEYGLNPGPSHLPPPPAPRAATARSSGSRPKWATSPPILHSKPKSSLDAMLQRGAGLPDKPIVTRPPFNIKQRPFNDHPPSSDALPSSSRLLPSHTLPPKLSISSAHVPLSKRPFPTPPATTIEAFIPRSPSVSSESRKSRASPVDIPQQSRPVKPIPAGPRSHWTTTPYPRTSSGQKPLPLSFRNSEPSNLAPSGLQDQTVGSDSGRSPREQISSTLAPLESPRSSRDSSLSDRPPTPPLPPSLKLAFQNTSHGIPVIPTALPSNKPPGRIMTGVDPQIGMGSIPSSSFSQPNFRTDKDVDRAQWSISSEGGRSTETNGQYLFKKPPALTEELHGAPSSRLTQPAEKRTQYGAADYERTFHPLPARPRMDKEEEQRYGERGPPRKRRRRGQGPSYSLPGHDRCRLPSPGVAAVPLQTSGSVPKNINGTRTDSRLDLSAPMIGLSASNSRPSSIAGPSSSSRATPQAIFSYLPAQPMDRSSRNKPPSRRGLHANARGREESYAVAVRLAQEEVEARKLADEAAATETAKSMESRPFREPKHLSSLFRFKAVPTSEPGHRPSSLNSESADPSAHAATGVTCQASNQPIPGGPSGHAQSRSGDISAVESIAGEQPRPSRLRVEVLSESLEASPTDIKPQISQTLMSTSSNRGPVVKTSRKRKRAIVQPDRSEDGREVMVKHETDVVALQNQDTPGRAVSSVAYVEAMPAMPEPQLDNAPPCASEMSHSAAVSAPAPLAPVPAPVLAPVTAPVLAPVTAPDPFVQKTIIDLTTPGSAAPGGIGGRPTSAAPLFYGVDFEFTESPPDDSTSNPPMFPFTRYAYSPTTRTLASHLPPLASSSAREPISPPTQSQSFREPLFLPQSPGAKRSSSSDYSDCHPASPDDAPLESVPGGRESLQRGSPFPVSPDVEMNRKPDNRTVDEEGTRSGLNVSTVSDELSGRGATGSKEVSLFERAVQIYEAHAELIDNEDEDETLNESAVAGRQTRKLADEGVPEWEDYEEIVLSRSPSEEPRPEGQELPIHEGVQRAQKTAPIAMSKTPNADKQFQGTDAGTRLASVSVPADIDRVRVVIPISKFRRALLIARGIYEPSRDDYSGDEDDYGFQSKKRLSATKTKSVIGKRNRRQPIVTKAVGSSRTSRVIMPPNGPSRTVRVRSPSPLPERFHIAAAPFPGAYASILDEVLLDRCSLHDCKWLKCDCAMASENLMRVHMRNHLKDEEKGLGVWKLQVGVNRFIFSGYKGQTNSVEAIKGEWLYKCVWRGCDERYFGTKEKLLQHILGHHVSKTLTCPYDRCKHTFPSATTLARHVAKTHVNTFDQPRPLYTALLSCGRDPPPKRLPTKVPPYHLLTPLLYPSSSRSQEVRDNVREEVKEMCMTPSDPVMAAWVEDQEESTMKHMMDLSSSPAKSAQGSMRHIAEEDSDETEDELYLPRDHPGFL